MAAAEPGWCGNSKKHPAHPFVYQGATVTCWGVDQ